MEVVVEVDGVEIVIMEAVMMEVVMEVVLEVIYQIIPSSLHRKVKVPRR